MVSDDLKTFIKAWEEYASFSPVKISWMNIGMPENIIIDDYEDLLD